MKAVFLDAKTISEDISLCAISDLVDEFTCYPTTSYDQVIERLLGAQIVITNKVALDECTLSKLPNLKLICVAATGMDNINIIAAEKMGIVVKNVSGYAEYSIAQYVFSQILNHFHSIESHNEATKNGLWQQADVFCLHGEPIVELKNKTLGLIGYGVLANAVERVAIAFGMNVLVAERKGVIEVRENRVTFEYLLQEADIVSIHCPLVEETENLINNYALKLMKPEAILINTARGAIVNSEDLKAALLNNEIALAVLDVLELEPPAHDHPLLSVNIPNLKVTGHIAWATIESQQRLIKSIAANISEFYKHENQKLIDALGSTLI
ncbi:D-2-hydroxyacid dehydrogenase [Colwellia sp. MEBiC06753]